MNAMLNIFVTVLLSLSANAQIEQQWWYVNTIMNQQYFGDLRNIYVDTNEVICPFDKLVYGMTFRLKNNRLAPIITCVSADKLKINDVYNDQMNNQYFGPLRDLYVDTSPIFVPPNRVWKGFRFIKKINRVAPSIYSVNINGTSGLWIQNLDNNNFYFPKEPGLKIAYADKNAVITPTLPVAFMIHTKNNRISPMLLAPFSEKTSLTRFPYHAGHAEMASQVLSNKYYDVTWIHHYVKPWGLTATWISCVAADLLLDLIKQTGSNSRVADSSGANDLLSIVKQDVLDLPILSGLSGTDDWEWYVIACLNARSFDIRYFDSALSKYESKVLPYWDDTKCGGGAWWDEARTYKNAITNELLLFINTEFYFATNDNRYLNMAKKVWQWFLSSGMINSLNLINDGLTSNCQNNQQTTWSYNQGVILAGLANLYKITNDKSYLDQAWSLASSSMLRLSTNNIIKGYGYIDNQDRRVFNGIYIHYLAKYAKIEKDLSKRRKIAQFIFGNAEYALINSINKEGVIKAYWGDGSSGVFTSEGEISALALLNAAANVQYILG